MLTRLNEIKSKGDGFFTSSVSNHIIILFLFYACSQCNAHIEDLFTLSFQLSAVRCGTNLERESTHHLPSGLAGAGVAQRNATDTPSNSVSLLSFAKMKSMSRRSATLSSGAAGCKLRGKA